MRIIGGRYRGRRLVVPKGLPVRPTTDFAKEGLFNMLGNMIDFGECSVLDLFSGTGHISLEFASRGSKPVVAVDQHPKCTSFLRTIAGELGLEISTIKDDVFRFLGTTTMQFDVVFADPPYDMEGIPRIHELVYSRRLLRAGGLLVIEHGASTKPGHLAGFTQTRRYGNVNFSFFRQEGWGEQE